MLQIRQPVAVKFILTDMAKQQIIAEQRRQIEQLSFELDQIEEQGKLAIEQAMTQSGELAAQVRDQVQAEKDARVQQREQLIEQMQQIQQMELGAEIQNMNVETVVDVKVGDDWSKVLMGSEIIVKDGIIHEIRQNGESFVAE